MLQLHDQQDLNEYEDVPKKKIVEKKQKLDQDLLEQLIMLQNFNQILDLALPKNYKEYSRIKYKNKFYAIGDSLLILYYKNNKKIEQIGRLKRIVSVKSFIDESQLPLVVVNWYCNKDDLPTTTYGDYSQIFSIYELFQTELESTLFIDSIQHLCKVYNFDDYEQQLGSSDERVYFKRSNYDSLKEILTPHPKDWPFQCICGTPPNPDLTYVFCEKCQKWIHLFCANLTQEEANEIDFYICKKCNVQKDT